MRRVAVRASDIVAPVFAAAEVIVLFLARMTGKTSLRDLLGCFVLERNDLRRIAFFRVGLAWSMAGLAAGHLLFPTAEHAEFGRDINAEEAHRQLTAAQETVEREPPVDNIDEALSEMRAAQARVDAAERSSY